MKSQIPQYPPIISLLSPQMWVVLSGIFIFTTLSGAATLNVGPGQAYSKPCAALTTAKDGDTVLIDASGSYNGDVCGFYANNLTIRGVNGRPHIDAAGQNAQGKGIWVIGGNNVTVDNIEFSGATVSGGNGAGIRAEGGNITIRNSYFHNNQMGILTANLGWGEVLIEYSEFAHNGTNNGFTHNIYVGQQAKFTLRYSYSHDSNGGQLVKSRAAETHILYNRLSGESGASNYEVDIPNGGLAYVIGNVIQQGPNSTNSTVLEYLLEGTNSFNPSHQLYVINNTFINGMSRGYFMNIGGAADPVVAKNNIFAGVGTVNTQSSAVMSNNFVGDPKFVNAAGYDYHLQAGSPAINAGTAPGTGSGQALNPDYEYAHPTCGQARIISGAIDIGAYEYGNSGAMLVCAAGGTSTSTASSGGSGSSDSVGTYSVTANPTTVIPNGTLSISWTAPSGSAARDWVGIFSSSAPNQSFGWWKYTGGAATGTITAPAPAQAGQYQVRYLLNDGFTSTASSNFTVASSNTASSYTLTASPADVTAGGNLTVSWTAPSGRPTNDWIGLFKAGDPDSVYGWWKYTNGASSGTFTAPAPAAGGQYEFRYLQQNGYTDVARSGAIAVNAAAAATYTLTATPSTANPGGTLSVNWTAPAGSNAKDWVALFKVGAPANTFGAWKYTGGATSGSFTTPAPSSGQYEFRYLLKDGFTDTARSSTVTVNPLPGYVLTAAPASASANATITVSWTAPSGRPANDWVGLYVQGAADNAWTWWKYTGGATSGSFSIPAPKQGQYEFRYYLQNGFNEAVWSNPVNVQ